MTAVGTTLDVLVSPLAAATFLEDHWPERAVALGPSAERLALFGALTEVALEALADEHPGPTHAVGDSGAQEPVADGGAAAALRAGRSLCLGGAHTTFAEVRSVLEQLASAVGLGPEAAQCNAYISPAGEGVPWHFDNREVLIVHLQGRKRWTLAPNAGVRWPAENGVLEAGAPAPEPATDFEMTPGAALFIPRGTWHTTTAAEPSLSLTFGLFTPTPLEILLDAIRRECETDERFRRPVALASPAQRETAQAQLAALLAPWRNSAR